MPLYKYKTFEEAEQALWNFKPDSNYFERVKRMFEIAGEFYNPIYPKGIHKYKTFEEAQADMYKWRFEKL